jgi:glucose dehydrogenase
MKIIKLGLALALAATLAACQKPEPKAGNVDGARIAAADANGEWVSYGKGYSEQRFSPLDKVSTANIGQLGLAWYAAVRHRPRPGSHAADGRRGDLHLRPPGRRCFAFDAATGKQLWAFDPKVEAPRASTPAAMS